MPGPLDGVKVADFTEIIAGPLAGRLLADLGADVIKVEPPWGEPWRLTQRFTPSESRTFMTYNRGKRSLPLDLTKKGAVEILKRYSTSLGSNRFAAAKSARCFSDISRKFFGSSSSWKSV